VNPGSGQIPLQIYLPGLRALTGVPVPVRELDVVAIPPQTAGSGIGVPPRLTAPLPVPAGFRLVRAVAARTYTVLQYRSATPVAVTAAVLAGDQLGSGGSAALIQPRP
jgi:hypothetical protein